MIEDFDLSLHLFEHLLLFLIDNLFLLKHFLSSSQTFLETIIIISI
jgi:hypothetical protein